jgi:glycosyltransferase involved in cell wall biosynthesis
VKIAVVTHFYPPEPGAGALRVASLVEALARAGHDVTVITSYASFPTGSFSEKRRSLVRADVEGNVRTVRLFSWLARGWPGARLLHWLSAACAASVYLTATRDRYDVVVVSSPPVTLAIPGLIGAWRHRARLVVDVRDVFPDVAVAMGEWKQDALSTRVVEWLVRRLYARANLVVAVTPTAISQIAERGVDASRLVLARNAAGDASGPVEVRRRPSNGSAARDFTAIFAGNLGLSTDLDVIVDAAAQLGDDGIVVEIVGDGAQRSHLEERIRNEGVRNVVLKGSFPRAQAMQMIADADVSIVSLRKGIEESIPTKLYDALSVGCPVVVVAEGEASREGASLGALCTPPGDATALAGELRRLSNMDRTALRQLGDKGQQSIAGRANRSRIMADLAARISSLVPAKFNSSDQPLSRYT